jgi:hypothetical protein
MVPVLGGIPVADCEPNAARSIHAIFLMPVCGGMPVDETRSCAVSLLLFGACGRLGGGGILHVGVLLGSDGVSSFSRVSMLLVNGILD